MELSVKREELLKELAQVQGIVEKKSTIPTLSHALIKARDGQLSILATDLEVSYRATIPAEVKGSGAIALQARRLFDLVRSIDSEAVTLAKRGGNAVTLTGGAFTAQIYGLPEEDFPSIPEAKFTGGVKLPLAVLKEMLAQVAIAAATEDTRFAIAGCLMKLGEGGIALVATDGHRLALVRRDMVISGAQNASLMVPRKAMLEIAKLDAPKGEDGKAADPVLEFAHHESHLFMQAGPRLLISRLLDKSFPNYEGVIPQDNDKEVIAGRAQFSDAIKRALILASEKSSTITLAFEPGQLTVSSSNPDAGGAEEKVPVKYDGPRLVIGFNGRYLLDFLGVSPGDEISLKLRDGERQGLFSPQAGGSQFTYIVMPVKI